MIREALMLLVTQVNQYIFSLDRPPDTPSATENEMVLGNISLAESDSGNNADWKKLVLSLVNIEEEQTMKNRQHFRKEGTSVHYLNPPVNLNLYLLFSANYDKYDNALQRLSEVISFFQGKNTFTFANSPVGVGNIADNPKVKNMKLILDLYTLTFEQINHLWGSLGGKQVPFAMYKMRLISIQTDTIYQGGGLIEEIEAKTKLLS